MEHKLIYNNNWLQSPYLKRTGWDVAAEKEQEKMMQEWATLKESYDTADVRGESEFYQRENSPDAMQNGFSETIQLAPGIIAQLHEIKNKDGVHVVCMVNGIAQELGGPLRI